MNTCLNRLFLENFACFGSSSIGYGISINVISSNYGVYMTNSKVIGRANTLLGDLTMAKFLTCIYEYLVLTQGRVGDDL